jgi:hypothetical protein
MFGLRSGGKMNPDGMTPALIIASVFGVYGVVMLIREMRKVGKKPK